MALSARRVACLLPIMIICQALFRNFFVRDEVRRLHNFAPARTKSDEAKMKNILKRPLHFIAKDFIDDEYRNQLVFPRVGIIYGEGIKFCPLLNLTLIKDINSSVFERERLTEWGDLVTKGVKNRKEEFLQEIGFIEWIRNHYPRSFTIVSNRTMEEEDKSTSVVLTDLHQISPTPRVLLPFCGFYTNPKPNPSEHMKGAGRAPLGESSNAMEKLEKQLPSKNIFYVAPFPGTTEVPWEYKINNARSLKIDQQTKGFFNDIIIPISAKPSTCDYFSKEQNMNKSNLLFSCGYEHIWSAIYKGIREKLPRIFNALNKTAINMSSQRTKEEYDTGFHTSKFCFVIPGDTTATSQASKAMLAGCVPLFIALDFRDLPFANILNYSSFSLRFHTNHFITGNATMDEERAVSLYHVLEDMVQNGTYDDLRRNVEIARDFFNYHRFTSRSPYGAALASMYLDEMQATA